MTIGERIKTLRRKNDMTQEKLADYLGVSYQAVSKWETGLNSPDLSLIGPLARLFDVTADELLGLAPAETDERRTYFDSEMVEHWMKDDQEENYRTALQAVAEYPGDFRYLKWLASAEYHTGFNDHYKTGDDEDHHERIDDSIKHYQMVVEDCHDEKLRCSAIYMLVLIYSILHKQDEAKKYAEMYPEDNEESRDDALRLCLSGEELRVHHLKVMLETFSRFCNKMFDYWEYCNYEISHEQIRTAIDAEEAMIRAFISDGNFLAFNWDLYHIYHKRAELAVKEDDFDGAVAALTEVKRYAAEYDRARAAGKVRYTCPLFDGYEQDLTVARPVNFSNYFRDELSDKQYDPLRDRADFKALTE